MEKKDKGSALPPLPESLKRHKFKIKEKVLSIGNKYIIEDAAENLVGFCKQKILKMKEDIRIYKDKTKKEELFKIKQKNILDFSGTFEVIDSKTEQTVGYLKRRGFKSMIKDEWTLMDPEKKELGRVTESSFILALMRRRGPDFIPYKYRIELDGKKVGSFSEKFTLVKDVYDLDTTDDPDYQLDRRLLLSIAICLDAIEGE